MRRDVMFASLGLLFLAAILPSQAQKGGGGRGGGTPAAVRVAEGAALTLECPLRVEAAAAWRREGGPLPGDLAQGERTAADGRLVARLTAPRAAPHHAGVYSCGPAPEQRLRLDVLEAAAPPLAASADDAVSGGGAGDSDPVHYYDVGHEIALTCSLSNPTTLPYLWKKNGTAVEQLWDLAGRYRTEEGGARFVLPARTHEDDYGNYSCHVGEGQGGAGQTWRVHGRPHSKLPANTNVVEGQKLKLQCRVFGKPWPAVSWLYVNSTEEEEVGNRTDALLALAGRANLTRSEQGVEGGALVVEAAARTDAGRYICRVSDNQQHNGATVLRVKDMYAALWPFLGICAEVLVLCAIILVYEKRRTKPEMDDSDTDNHDQKKS